MGCGAVILCRFVDMHKLVAQSRDFINTNAREIAVWGILGMLSITFFGIYGKLAQDDAFITYRYARNIASGMGFVYNDGEWVLGTTTPLYTLVLAVFAYLFPHADVTQISIVISTISLWISAGMIYEISASMGKEISLSVALYFITIPFLSTFIGMESYFGAGLLLLTIWAYCKGHLKITAILNGLLIITRYEMVLLTFVLVGWDVFIRRRIPFWLWMSIPIVGTWLLYATLVFHTPMPLSASAKLTDYHIPFLLGGLMYGYSSVMRAPLEMLSIGFTLLGIWAAARTKRLPSGIYILLIFSFAYLIVAAIFAGSFPWYYAPLMPALAVLVILGIQYFASVPLKQTGQSSKVIKRYIFLICVAVLVISHLFIWKQDHLAYKSTVGDSRYAEYARVIDWLNQNASSGQSIALFEIGYVGYFTHDLKIIDFPALVTPEMLPWVGKNTDVRIMHAIRIFEPDFILVLDTPSERHAVESSGYYQIVNLRLNRFLLYQKKH